ncbi:MAG TPA: hypothetical protein DCY27_04245 [Desulfobacterales bacterium]|nr:hypothetical protein [Desulfobacterales bacterium]
MLRYPNYERDSDSGSTILQYKCGICKKITHSWEGRETKEKIWMCHACEKLIQEHPGTWHRYVDI